MHGGRLRTLGLERGGLLDEEVELRRDSAASSMSSFRSSSLRSSSSLFLASARASKPLSLEMWASRSAPIAPPCRRVPAILPRLVVGRRYLLPSFTDVVLDGVEGELAGARLGPLLLDEGLVGSLAADDAG